MLKLLKILCLMATQIVSGHVVSQSLAIREQR